MRDSSAEPVLSFGVAGMEPEHSAAVEEQSFRLYGGGRAAGKEEQARGSGKLDRRQTSPVAVAVAVAGRPFAGIRQRGSSWSYYRGSYFAKCLSIERTTVEGVVVLGRAYRMGSCWLG